MTKYDRRAFLEYIDPKQRNVWCKNFHNSFFHFELKNMRIAYTQDDITLLIHIYFYFPTKLKLSQKVNLATSSITAGFMTKYLSLKCLAPHKPKRKWHMLRSAVIYLFNSENEHITYQIYRGINESIASSIKLELSYKLDLWIK